MQHGSVESLVEERVAQLAEITQRRNALLRQMFQMIRRMHSVASVLSEDEDEEGLKIFLKRFDLHIDGPEAGSIVNLDETDPFEESSLDSSLQPTFPSRGKSRSGPRAPRSRIRPLDAKSPSFHPYYPPKQILSDTLENTSAERIIDKDPFEHRHPQPVPAPLQRPDDFDDEPDELDLLGIPSPSIKRRTSYVSPGNSLDFVAGDLETATLKSAIGEVESLEEMEKRRELLVGDAATQAFVSEEAAMNGDELSIDIPIPRGEERTIVEHEGDHIVNNAPAIESGEVFTGGVGGVVVREGTVSMDLGTMSEVVASLEDKQKREQNYPKYENVWPGIHSMPDTGEPGFLSNEVRAMQNFLLLPPDSLSSPIPNKSLPLPIIVTASTPRAVLEKHFNFDVPLVPAVPSPKPLSPGQSRHHIQFNYGLPSLKYLPLEYNRKTRPTKLQRKREKEREKNEGRKDKDFRDDWVPMGLNRWAATISANPVYKRVSRASKCLSTRDWAVAMSEIRLMRALERVEILKREGRWGFRQPKKQRGVGGLTKTHWDHLLDEMKWMRIDFREERKWKMALAFNLSTAVLEWHMANSLKERLEKGICVRWTPSLRMNDTLAQDRDTDVTSAVVEADNISHASEVVPKISLLGVDYGSDDDDDEEEADKQLSSISDPLVPTAMIEDALDSVALQVADDINAPFPLIIQPKTEDIDDPSVLNDHINVGAAASLPEDSDAMLVDEKCFPSGLKSSSVDPVLGSKQTPSSSNDDVEPIALPIKTSAKVSMYTPFREHVAYSDDTKLFLDDLALSKLGPLSENLTGSEIHLDLSSIFPDLQPLGILDIPSVVISGVPDGKRRSDKRSDRDDPTKRTEDTTYAKLFPIGDFMFSKPTLLGPLEPSKNWRKGRWATFEDSAGAEADSLKVLDDGLNVLFDSRSTNSPTSIMTLQMQAAFLKEKDPRKRGADHLWSLSDDTLLKSLIDRYPNNWALISECFNASRLTISTDKRTPRDCLERWKDKWGIDPRQRPSEHSTVVEDTPPPTPSQMTTRGVKRLASASVSTPITAGGVGGSEPRKRRRHALVTETIRKAAKKRADLAQKALANQRKPPAIHETHAQYNKMTKHTPAELSRMKAEKEARDLQDLQVARRRQEELTRQNNMLQANRMNLPVIQQQLLGAPQRSGGPGIVQSQGVPQIRSQVNISQQQRIGTPSMPPGNSRLSPQQLMQVQQARAAAQQQVQQAQGQVPVPNQGQNSNINVAHVSPPHTSATPSNAVVSPRPPSAQGHPLLQAAQPPGNGILRQGGNAYYGIPGIGNIRDFTQEQIAVIRTQLQQQSQQQGSAQGSSNNFTQQP